MNTADSYLHSHTSPAADFGNWIVARLPRQLYAAKFSAGRQIPQHLLYKTYRYKGWKGEEGGGTGYKAVCREHVQKQKSAYNEIKTWTLQAKKFRQPSRGR